MLVEHCATNLHIAGLGSALMLALVIRIAQILPLLIVRPSRFGPRYRYVKVMADLDANPNWY